LAVADVGLACVCACGIWIFLKLGFRLMV